MSGRLFRFNRALLLACIVLSAIGPHRARAATGERVALVIGNGGYLNVPALKNTTNDANLIASTLVTLGFRLVGGKAYIDLTKTELDGIVQEFGRESADADIALFYYAGHGLEAQGINYIVPTDANPVKQSDLPFQMLDAQFVLKEMEDSNAHVNVMILDACRNNPFGVRATRGSTGGLAQMETPQGTLISFSTQPGNVASDGIVDSPYTQALADVMPVHGLDILRMFNNVGLAVLDKTHGTQLPWVSNSPIRGDFYFAGPPNVVVHGADSPPADVRIVGGKGGSYQTLSCVPGEALLGLTGTKGAFLYQIGIICGALEPPGVKKPRFVETSRRGPYGQAYRSADHWELRCDDNALVTGARIGTAAYSGGTFVGSVRLRCSPLSAALGVPASVDYTQTAETQIAAGVLAAPDDVISSCIMSAVVKLHLRTGAWIDALGLECGLPALAIAP